MLRRLMKTDAPGATLFIRVMVGGVFLSEGIQKFAFPDQRGAGRFADLGLPMPELLGPFVGGVEVLCGTLVFLGMFTRLACVPLVVIMLVALATTKVPTLLQDGFWQAAHDSRTDVSMLLGSIFLIIVGGGRGSPDANLSRDDDEIEV